MLRKIFILTFCLLYTFVGRAQISPIKDLVPANSILINIDGISFSWNPQTRQPDFIHYHYPYQHNRSVHKDSIEFKSLDKLKWVQPSFVDFHRSGFLPGQYVSSHEFDGTHAPAAIELAINYGAFEVVFELEYNNFVQRLDKSLIKEMDVFTGPIYSDQKSALEIGPDEVKVCESIFKIYLIRGVDGKDYIYCFILPNIYSPLTFGSTHQAKLSEITKYVNLPLAKVLGKQYISMTSPYELFFKSHKKLHQSYPEP